MISFHVTNVVKDLCHFLLLCPALEKIRRPLLNDISFNTVELDFVDLPNYIKIKLLIGDCGFYINGYCFLNSFCLTNYLSTANWFDKEV
jgi:hypothetical protein